MANPAGTHRLTTLDVLLPMRFAKADFKP
jgi:hypothetical protein